MDPLFLPLSPGTHPPGSLCACAMEAVSVLAGEEWSDHPRCTDPALAGLMHGLNDSLPESRRSKLLSPLLLHLIGTAGTWRDTEARLRLLGAWCTRFGGALSRLGGLLMAADTEESVMASCYAVADLATRRLGLANDLIELLERGLIPIGPCAPQEVPH